MNSAEGPPSGDAEGNGNAKSPALPTPKLSKLLFGSGTSSSSDDDSDADGKSEPPSGPSLSPEERRSAEAKAKQLALSRERLSGKPDDAYRLLFSEDGPVSCRPCEASAVKGGAMYLCGAPVEQPPDVIRFVCVSDTHGRHRKIGSLPPADVLLHAGDITNVGELDQLQDFSKWLGEQSHIKHKVVIAGNHDVTLDRAHYSQEANQNRWHGYGRNGPYNIDECRAAIQNCIFLEDAQTTVEGYTIYGSPWQPEFYDWAFNLERGAECRAAWAKIPQDGTIDILITHGPPIGFGDLCSGGNRAGCVDLLHTIRSMKRQPKFHVFGHIHEAYGAWSDGKTNYVNASTATLRYRMDHKVIVFDLPRKPPVGAKAGPKAGGASQLKADDEGTAASLRLAASVKNTQDADISALQRTLDVAKKMSRIDSEDDE